MRMLLTVAFGALVAMADPIDITTNTVDVTTTTIDLSGSGLLPTAGTFTYDAGTHIFSSVSNTWDSFNFDLATSAAVPLESTSEPSCTGSSAGGTTSLALVTGPCATPSTGLNTVWSGNIPNGVLAIETDSSTQFFQIEGNVTSQSAGIFASDDQAITAVPEPSSFVLVLLLLLAIAFVARNRI